MKIDVCDNFTRDLGHAGHANLASQNIRRALVLTLLATGMVLGFSPCLYGDSLTTGLSQGVSGPLNVPAIGEGDWGRPLDDAASLVSGYLCDDAAWLGDGEHDQRFGLNPAVSQFPQYGPISGVGYEANRGGVIPVDMERLLGDDSPVFVAGYPYKSTAAARTEPTEPVSQLNGDSLKPDARTMAEEKVSIVPEPATLALFGIALAGWASSKLRHRLVRI